MEKKLIPKFIKTLTSFFNDDTSYYAASLSFFTIFSMLPILALLIFIVSSLQIFQEYLEQFMSFILDSLNPTNSDVIVQTFNNFISNTDKLGYMGIVYMCFVFIMFFKDYEYIVNKIHNCKRKPLYKTFFFYLFFLIALPFSFIIFSIIITFYSNSFFIKIISFFFPWLTMYYLFKLSVNTYIVPKAALISSFFTLASIAITKNLFVFYVLYNQTYTTLYGSLSTLLFVFFWIYLSWMIFLYGIKMCHKLNIKELKKHHN